MSLPPIKLTAPIINTLEECDAILGEYLRAWDQVEHQLLPLFNKLLGTHQNVTLVLLSVGIDQPKLRNILQSVSTFRLLKEDRKTLASLLRRWKTASTKRNRIVHGHWQGRIEMIEGPSGKRDHTKTEWVRFYNPSDPSVFEAMFGKESNKKLLAAHEFELKAIKRAATDVLKLSTDLKSYTDQLRLREFANPQPIDIDQSAI